MERVFKPAILILLGIFVLLAILGAIYYWGQLFRTSSQVTSDSLSKLRVNPTGVVDAVSTVAPVEEVKVSESISRTGNAFKTYTGENFIISYSVAWGLLTCNNSAHLEFDPTNNTDMKNFSCDRAIKPVTVLVSKTPFNNCAGNFITLGNLRVQKSQINYPNGNINYKWCLSLGNHYFNITHRVSPLGSQATSQGDFSNQVEQLIKDLRVTTSS